MAVPTTAFGQDLPTRNTSASIGADTPGYATMIATSTTQLVQGDNVVTGSASVTNPVLSMPSLGSANSTGIVRLYYTQPSTGNTFPLFQSNVVHPRGGYSFDPAPFAVTVMELFTSNGGASWYAGSTSDVPGIDPLLFPNCRVAIEATAQTASAPIAMATVYNRVTTQPNLLGVTVNPTLNQPTLNVRTPTIPRAYKLDFNAASAGALISGLPAMSSAQPWVMVATFAQNDATAGDKPLFQFNDGSFFGYSSNTGSNPFVFNQGQFTQYNSIFAQQADGKVHTLSLVWPGSGAGVTRWDGARITKSAGLDWALPNGNTAFYVNRNAGGATIGKLDLYAMYVLYGAGTLTDDTHVNSPVQLIERWSNAMAVRGW